MTAQEYNRQLPCPGDYARSWAQLLLMDPDQDVRVPGWIVGMPGWGDQYETVAKVLSHMDRALHSRINARAGFVPREPREEEYRLRQDANDVRDILVSRRRVYQFRTRVARARFGHLLAERDD